MEISSIITAIIITSGKLRNLGISESQKIAGSLLTANRAEMQGIQKPIKFRALLKLTIFITVTVE
jgi:hypothetical protein